MVELLTVACPVAALPSELLPCIFTHLASPPHLHAAALVCKIWYPFVQEILYSHVWVRPWQKGADWKLVRLLETLSNGGSLSKLVQRLEVRSYPPPQIITNLVSSQTLLTFLSLPNLTSLAFTRDHSLSNALISAISTSMPNLRELEINAHSIGCFDPRSLLKIKGRLQRLALVMPDRGTVGVLEEWIRGIYEHSLEADARYPGLHELTILSKSSPIITDDFLTSLSTSLPHLRALNLTSSSRVTSAGVLSLLRAAAFSSRRVLSQQGPRSIERGVIHLSLESLDHLSLQDLQPELSILAPFLRYISLSSPASQPRTDHLPPTFIFETVLAPHASTLETIHISQSAQAQSQMLTLPPRGFPRLRTLTLPPTTYRDTLPSDLALLTPSLTNLFIGLHNQSSFDHLRSFVGQWSNLHTVHFLLPSSNTHTPWEPTLQDLQTLALASPSLRQVGCRTRVYDILRSMLPSPFSSSRTPREEVTLVRFDMEQGGRVPNVYLLGRFLG